MKYKGSVIIPTYNRSDLLKLTLESIVKQNINLRDIEVIVCDDGSSDDTKSATYSFSKKLNIKYLFQEDKGFRAGKARNMGIKAADSNLCIFVDTGILLGSNTINEYIKCYESDNNTVIIGTVLGFHDLNANEDILTKVVDIRDIDKSIDTLMDKKVYDSRERYYNKYGEDLSKWKAPWVIMWGCNVGISKDSLLRVGLFDEYYNTWGGEDTDLGIALYKNNNKFISNKKCVAVDTPHAKHHSMISEPKEFQMKLIGKAKYMNDKYNDISTRLAMYYDYYDLNELLSIE